MRVIRPVTVTDSNLTSSDVTETVAVYVGATTYALNDLVRVESTHHYYKSLQNANTGHDPIAEPATPVWWLDMGAVNRWAMFDTLVNSQTTNANSIAVVVTPAERVDSVILLNVSAATVDITMTDAVDGEVFSESYSMTSDSGIIDWYAYFFEPIIRKSDLSVTGMPPYINAAIAITLTDTGDTAACGECLIGLSRNIGVLVYGAKVGIRDYSVKTQDDFGNYTILERAFSKRGSFEIWVPEAITSELQILLAGYRATPIAYIGSDDIDATIIYGFYRDFEIDIAYRDYSVCSIEIEGLT